MGANFPGQSVTSCGQPSQVASCGSHSAGMRKPRAGGVSLDGGVLIGRKNLTQRSQRTQGTRRKQRGKEKKGRGKEKSPKGRRGTRRRRVCAPGKRFRMGW